MALRAVKPTTIKKRLKLFLYGESNSGKTTAARSPPLTEPSARCLRSW